MFGFLKDKLKGVVDSFKKEVAEDVKEVKVDEVSEKDKEVLKKEEAKETQRSKASSASKPKVLSEKKAEKKSEKKVEKKEEKKPESKKEEKEEEKKPETKKVEVKEEKPKKEEEKPVPKKEEIKSEKKEKKEEKTPDSNKEEKKDEKKPETKKVEIKEEKLELIDEEDLPKEKQGFFKKLFGKKEEEEVKEAQSNEVVSEPKPKEVLSEPAEVKPKEEEKEKEVAKEQKESVLKEVKEETSEVKEEPLEETKEEKKGFFSRLSDTITKFNLSEEKFESIFWELELVLLENNVAVEVIEKIKLDLKEELCTGKVSRKGIEDVIKDSLRNSIEEVLSVETFDIIKKSEEKKPYVIVFIGVNGSGKTTNLAKVAKKFQDAGKSIVFAAADTFRAAAIQQLEEHANNLKIKMIKHDYNADPAAVAFDAIEHAKAKGIDIVMIDTAGRLHSNSNLMDELKKLIRVNKPDLKIFVGESITGNDCVEQATKYNEEVGIDAIILSKADVDEKGGAAISVSYVTKKPIIFIGTGQTYNDLRPFDKELILKSLDLD